MDISKLSVSELKVLSYDILVSLETGQKNLRVIAEEINKRSQESEKIEKPVDPITPAA